MPKVDDDVIEFLSEPEPPPEVPVDRHEPWNPKLGPAQKRAFDSTARYLLCHSEKASGKTVGLLHKLVRHAYENTNALCLILVRVRAMATKGGAWDKLTQLVLPEWKNGISLKYTDVKFDTQHNEYLWIQNKFGSWSMVVLISAPHAHQLRERIRGYEPSFALVDELTSCDDIEYLRAVAAQIGRRPGVWVVPPTKDAPGVPGVQQYTAACNPEGPSHWVYIVWWVEAYDEDKGEWDHDYEKIHIPIQENKDNLPPGYVENLVKLYKNDPVEAARMLDGEWIDRPSGHAIFKDVFVPAQCVRPEPQSPERIMPVPGYPLIVGLDPGSVYNAFVFLQRLPVEGALKWVAFDEVVTTRRRIRYEVLVPIVLRRTKWWEEQVGPLQSVWISDSSAFNQFRATSGSYDVLEFEKVAAKVCPALGLSPLVVRQCPKFNGSVPTRTRLVIDLLGANELIIGSNCTKLQNMFLKLESKDQPVGQPFDPNLSLTPKRSDHLHVFDALSYPILASALQPELLTPQAPTTQSIVRIRS